MAEVYPLVHLGGQALNLAPSAAALTALPPLLVAVLCGQRLRPSALMQPVPARQRYKRVARFWERP